MKNIATIVLLALCGLSGGCATLSGLKVTTNDGIAIAQPLVSGGLSLILRNNPTYIPVASKVGADLAALNYSDLTLTGINAAVTAAVTKEGGDPALAAILSSGLDAGLAGYLAAVAESSLASDPNAQLVLQALGTAITNGASIAAANPK